MDELNPEHRVTKTLHDHWHKIAAVLLGKLGGEIVLTAEDLREFAMEYPDSAVLAHDKKDGLHLKILTREEAVRLTKQ